MPSIPPRLDRTRKPPTTSAPLTTRIHAFLVSLRRTPQPSTSTATSPTITKATPKARILPSLSPFLARLRPSRRTLLLFLSGYASMALIRSYLISYSDNAGVSMLPTIAANGTYSLSSLLYGGGRGIKIGDIVQVKSPVQGGQIVGKRVVGLPGDYVLRGRDGEAGVGGVTAGEGRLEGEREEPLMVQVPEGHVWLAGDNMAWSRDSRFYGPVPLALIRAKTLWHVRSWRDWEGTWWEQVRKVEEGEEV
jgi:mitochondrial inner membrane protease subunit 1